MTLRKLSKCSTGCLKRLYSSKIADPDKATRKAIIDILSKRMDTNKAKD